MKFTHEKFPVLNRFETGLFGIVGINPDHMDYFINSGLKDRLRDTFKAKINDFKSNIQYIARTMVEAIELSSEKLLSDDLIKKIGSCKGTFLLPNGTQICYEIIDFGDDWDYCLYQFNSDFLIQSFVSYYHLPEMKSSGFSYGYDKSPDFSYVELFKRVALLVNFIKYADTEVLIAKPSRPIDGPGCVYNNKTKTNIQCIDSKWITTLVKSDAFKVRGHFRLQPCGHGMKDRRLIWINEFQKEGYTREAKILSEHPTTAGTL